MFHVVFLAKQDPKNVVLQQKPPLKFSILVQAHGPEAEGTRPIGRWIRKPFRKGMRRPLTKCLFKCFAKSLSIDLAEISNQKDID
jgi:hypothetical protein